MTAKQYRISFSSSKRSSIYSYPVDFDNFNEFIEYLEDNNIMKVSLKYNSIIDDTPSWLKDGAGLKIEDLTIYHFEWLTAKVKDVSRFLEIDYKSTSPYVIKRNMMHEKLMPFKEKQLIKYFDKSQVKQLIYFTDSIIKYRKYEADIANFSKADYKVHRQAEKDERFYTTRTFINLFEREIIDRNTKLKSLLVKAFGELPPFTNPFKYPLSWENLLNGELKLLFEHDIPAPKEYKEYLSNHLPNRHFVPYVLDTATHKDKTFRKDLEGPSQIDAFIENPNSGLKIFIEAKYLSDISCNVSYDVSRNQIARNIDVMLEDKKGKSIFILLTPKYFKDNPHTRLYGYKMNDYINNHLELMADLCHRRNIEPSEWKAITKRIAWVTWEDLTGLGL